MKPLVYLVFFLSSNALSAAVPMSRVIEVVDGKTIRVEQATVTLANVTISPGEEAAATEYLHRLLDGAWVYVENGDVYRSPDGLYVNGEMQRRAWRSSSNMRYLGSADPLPAIQPAPSGKSGSQSGSRRRAPARRSVTRYRR